MAVDDQPIIKTMPIDLQEIKKYQDKEKLTEKLIGIDKRYHLKNLYGAGYLGLNGPKHDPLCYSDRNLVPKVLQSKILEWYHHLLVHPGRDRMLKTISQHFYWKKMAKDVEQFCKKCPICQTTKASKSYGFKEKDFKVSFKILSTIYLKG